MGSIHSTVVANTEFLVDFELECGLLADPARRAQGIAFYLLHIDNLLLVCHRSSTSVVLNSLDSYRSLYPGKLEERGSSA